MFELLIKLLEKGVELLREGERQKRLFYDEIVEPIQSTFEKIYQDHIKTFEKTRIMLLDPASDPNDIVSLVQGNILFEKGKTNLLYRLTGDKYLNSLMKKPKKGQLTEHFDTYVECIAECLISPTVESQGPSIMYYVALNDVVNSLSANPNKKNALNQLETIVNRFQNFYAQVASNYIVLKRYCSA